MKKPENALRRRESGQVLLTGIIMMLILLLALLLLFDIHSMVRGKYKTETANQAAAMAGAEWQKESLNLIGEINLIKACETMLEAEDHWPSAVAEPDPDATGEIRRWQRLAGRVGLLTEMQSRVAFLGPLVGFAAAQQAAKRNGMTPVRNTDMTMPLQGYVDRLNTDWRYLRIETVRNFKWREPYTRMMEDIIAQGVVAYPNARVAGNPIVDPPGLANESLYTNIMTHRAEIAAKDPPDQSSWLGVIYPFIKNKTNADYEGKWWNIDYNMSVFPGESEIFTLGVEYGNSGYDEDAHSIIQNLLGDKTAYRVGELPAMTFCLFDSFWYPEHYRTSYSGYDEDHYSWWYEGGVLRKPVKTQYQYEGPAAYAETAAEINLAGRYAMQGGGGADVDRRFIRRRDPNHNDYSRKVGSRRVTSTGNLLDTGYRPGAIAKVLGELDNNVAPIALPIILPVFDNTSLMPTYMPIPYGFGVLRIGSVNLERFLSWLSRQESLFDYGDSPPAGTEWYLEALQLLTDGAGFRYYGWNPNWNAAAFDRRYAANAATLFSDRSYVYSQSNSTGAGWLQEAQEFTLTSIAEIGVKEVTDHVNGGTALRFFKSSESRQYIVVNSKGHIVTNDEFDPTVLYSTGGGGHGSGPGFGGTQTRPDTQPGPPRI